MTNSGAADLNLDGKVIVITGGGSGLGRATAVRAAAHGARLVLGDRSGISLDETADAILSAAGQVQTVEMDVRNAADFARLPALETSAYGRIDGAVFAAGISGHVPAMEMTLEQWQEIIDINLTGVFLCIQSTAKVMIEKGNGGSIVPITSDLAIRGRPTGAHYVASKAGVIGLTKSFALALAPQGVRVNALAPGITDTPLVRGGMSQEDIDSRARVAPFGRIGLPEDVASVITLLLSDASAWMTGQTVYANGGMVMP
jgi:NAD(P)-dependent dehydrogenase (short-subunit alcohol dehydrogenase family)